MSNLTDKRDETEKFKGFRYFKLKNFKNIKILRSSNLMFSSVLFYISNKINTYLIKKNKFKVFYKSFNNGSQNINGENNVLRRL